MARWGPPRRPYVGGTPNCAPGLCTAVKCGCCQQEGPPFSVIGTSRLHGASWSTPPMREKLDSVECVERTQFWIGMSSSAFLRLTWREGSALRWQWPLGPMKVSKWEMKKTLSQGWIFACRSLSPKLTHSTYSYNRHNSFLCWRKRSKYIHRQRRTKVLLPSVLFLFLAFLGLPFLIFLIPVK